MDARTYRTISLSDTATPKFGSTGGLFNFAVAVCLLLSLFVASTDSIKLSSNHQNLIAVDHPANDGHEPIECDDGVVCSGFALPLLVRYEVFDTAGNLRFDFFERPFQQFMLPQVDLPPPRTTA